MNKFKRILAVLMSVILLSITVGNDYFDATHMDKVEATTIGAAAGLSAATLWQICFFVGSVFFISWAAGEVIDNQEEIARAGKNFIDSVKEIPEGFLSKITDISSGQDYVFGSEAFELIKDTPWEVIQGGAPNNNNNNDDDDDKKNWINLFSSANQYVGNFLALGATWFIAHASELYQKWVNGEEMTEAELAAIEPLISGYCNQYDVAAQWSGEPFDYVCNIKYSYDLHNNNTGKFIDHRDYVMKLHSTRSFPVAAYYHLDVDENLRKSYVIEFLRISDNLAKDLISTQISVETSTESRDGAAPTVYPYGSRAIYTFSDAAHYKNYLFSYGANCPVFASRIDAENYLRGTGDVTNALNYAKVYRHADWLSDDWSGQLVDPFTNIGITLNQLIKLMKELGIRAVGNDISPSDLLDLIKRSLPVVNPDLLPGEVPVTIPEPAPGTEPVYYPSPDAHPKPTKPGTDPDPDPGTDPDPDPGTDPDPEMSDYKVELSGIFPFCIPFDFIALLRVLSAEPEAPCFAFPIVIPALYYEETVYIDLSIFDDVAEVMRTCEKVGFIIFLMFATSKVIRW